MFVLIIFISAISCQSFQVDSKYNVSMYDSLTVPIITLSSYDFASSPLNQKIIDSITFSESMNKYGIVAIHVNNIASQKIFDESYSNILHYFVNTSRKYKQQFFTNEFPSPGWIPFKSEGQPWKYHFLLASPFYNDPVLKDDNIDMSNLNQTYEPMESFLFASNENKSSNALFVPNLNHIPKEFRSNVEQLWNEYHTILNYIFEVGIYSLGVNKSTNDVVNLLQRNEYFNVLKFAYYYGFDDDGTNKVYNASLNDYVYRYGIHYDVDMFTILKLDQTKGFQLRYNYKWYNIDVNHYPPNTFFVMSGNLMHFLTNGYWKPAPHRVLSMLPAKLTIVLFAHVPMDTIFNQFTNCYSCNQQKNNNETALYFKECGGKSEHELISEFLDASRMMQ